MSTPRILLALTYYRPHVSGLSICAERLARGLARRGHSVTVLTSRALKAEEIKPEQAEQALREATGPAAKGSADERLKAKERARAQLRVARHAGSLGETHG